MWLLFALLGPICWAASTHIDKYLVDRYFRHDDTAVLMVFTAFIGLVMLPPIAYWQSGVFSLGAFDMTVMIVSGVAYMAAMLFYLRAIQIEEASVVAPLFQTSTLFTFLFAYFLLGERLNALQLGGGALIVAGALLISFDVSAPARGLKLRLVLLMLACAGVLALSAVVFKYLAVRDEYWVTTFWNAIGEALFGLAILAVPRYRRQFVMLLRRNPGPVLGVNGANELINLGGGLSVRFASMLAPVALVSAVSSTSTLFVFAFGVALTKLFPRLGHEEMSRRNLLQKGVAAMLIAVGVMLSNRSSG